MVSIAITMSDDIRHLMKAYGIDEKSLEVTPEVLDRIKADRQRYINALDDETVKNHTKVTAYGKETVHIGNRYTKQQYNLSGRSLGRSSGPIKKSGANKRSGYGGEHGECLGASARTGWKVEPKFTVQRVATKTTTVRKVSSQVQAIVSIYDGLLEVLE